jgi:hypothetical protein
MQWSFCIGQDQRRSIPVQWRILYRAASMSWSPIKPHAGCNSWLPSSSGTISEAAVLLAAGYCIQQQLVPTCSSGLCRHVASDSRLMAYIATEQHSSTLLTDHSCCVPACFCAAAKRPKLAFEQAEEDAAAVGAAAAGAGELPDRPSGQQRQQQQRHFRGQRVETPSHPGGVSTPARETLEATKQRQKERERGGVYASTSYRSSRRDYDSRDRDGRDRREYDRGGRSERGDRDHRGSTSRDGGGGGGSSRRGDSSRWEAATPLRHTNGDADGGWESTPARPGSTAPGSTPLRDTRDPRNLAAPSPWETADGSRSGGRAGGGGATPRLPPRGTGSSTGTRAGGWGSSTAGGTDLPAVARPGGSTPSLRGAGGATGASGIAASIGRYAGVGVSLSTTLVPDWKTGWGRGLQAAVGVCCALK